MGAGPAPRSALPPLGEGGRPAGAGGPGRAGAERGRGASFLQGLGGEAARPGGKRPAQAEGRKTPLAWAFSFSPGKTCLPLSCAGAGFLLQWDQETQKKRKGGIIMGRIDPQSWKEDLPAFAEKTAQFYAGELDKNAYKGFSGCTAATPKRAGRPVCSGCG